MGSQSSVEYSKIVGNEEAKGETPIYRCNILKEDEDLVASLDDGKVNTLAEVLKHSFESYSDNACLGSREILSTDGDEVTYGDYKFKSYKECEDISKAFARALLDNELCPSIKSELNLYSPEKKEIIKEEREFRILGFYSKNREEWALGDMACIQANVTSVPLYDTLGKDTIDYIIDQTGLSTIICTQDKIENLTKLKNNGKAESLKYIICLDPCKDDIAKK